MNPMRDYRDAKAMARTLRAALAAKSIKITIAESLELTAKSHGAADWNTMAALIRQAAAPTPTPGPPLRPQATERPVTSRVTFSARLEASLYRAVASATGRKHQYTTLEHLLWALVDDSDAAAVMRACWVDLAKLERDLRRYLDEDLKELVTQEDTPPAPTAGFHRVVQRAMIHIQASGGGYATGANLLVAIFSETESHACAFLRGQGMTREAAVEFIVKNSGRQAGTAAA
jgi:hypothetical protein